MNTSIFTGEKKYEHFHYTDLNTYEEVYIERLDIYIYINEANLA